MSALQLSFNQLPSHTKRCFAYCKLFPKGYEFNINMLIQLWVAEGYIESEDKGIECFRMLWWRSFFQEVKMDELRNMSTCRMHDLMHDLAESVAGKKIIKRSSSIILEGIPSKTRHVAIFEGDDDDLGEEDYGDGFVNSSKVRTLICFKTLSRKEFEQIFQNFICLRVLVIASDCSHLVSEEGAGSDAIVLLHAVDNLKHLRYLHFCCTKSKKLPNSVTNLVNLPVLNLAGCGALEELPRDIKKLVNLKHLEFNADHLTHMPQGIGELKFLQTLPFFVVGKKSNSGNDEKVGAELDELKPLNALRGKLTIINLANVESPSKAVHVLEEKLHLQSLVLYWSLVYDKNDNLDNVAAMATHDEEILEVLRPHPNLKEMMIQRGGYAGMKLPNWLSSLTNLIQLRLEDCKRCEYLPQLHPMASLKKLIIESCPKLKGTRIDEGFGDRCGSSLMDLITMKEKDDKWPQFRCLTYLHFQDCAMLTWLPTFPTVEGEIELDNVTLAPLVRTMKMIRRGVADSSDEYLYEDQVDPLSKLTKLTLVCVRDDIESLPDDGSISLVSLQELVVRYCLRGVKLPGSLCSSINLAKVSVCKCPTIEYLPPLHELPSLTQLTIKECPKLKGCWWKKKGKDNKLGADDQYHHHDPSLKGDDKKNEDDEQEDDWPHFPCLSILEIEDCPMLTQMPLFPTVQGELRLKKTSSQALVRTMKMQVLAASASNHLHRHHDSHQHEHSTSTATSTTTTTSSPPSLRTSLVSPLSELASLYLLEMDDLEFIPEGGLSKISIYASSTAISHLSTVIGNWWVSTFDRKMQKG